MLKNNLCIILSGASLAIAITTGVYFKFSSPKDEKNLGLSQNLQNINAGRDILIKNYSAEEKYEYNPDKAKQLFEYGIVQFNEGVLIYDPNQRLKKFKVSQTLYENAYKHDPNNIIALGYATEVKERWIPQIEEEEIKKESETKKLTELNVKMFCRKFI